MKILFQANFTQKMASFCKQSLNLSLSMAVLATTLTACQSVKTQPQVNPISAENSKKVLADAVQKTLYRNQSWIAEHQIYLNANPEQDTKKNLTTDCQTEHDDALVTQMKTDKLTDFSQVADLPDDKKLVYEQIKQTFLACENTVNPVAEGIAEAEKDDNYLYESEIPSDDASDNNANIRESLNELNEIMGYIGLNQDQIRSLNQFMLKSGKLTISGNYQPYQGIVSMQLDAGFENKNLKYHYRLPLVANWKSQSLYVKPDVIMPSVALYLDNQLGMTWQDKWYKFSSNSEDLPANVTTKSWLMAIKQSFDALPNSQFRTINRNLLLPNIAYANQKIAENGVVIEWQQTAKEQDNLYQDMIENFIQQMDKQIANSNENQQKNWQNYKQKLNHYLEKRLTIEPSDDNRLTGQQTYFVVANGQLKQIFAKNTATSNAQSFQLNTWVTFDPNEKLITPINRPSTLNTLSKSINDTPNGNVIDAKAEIKRLVELDNSRRLFGEEPEWLKHLAKIADIDTELDNEDY
ncbi:hypothetical protein [Faucicola boevrei]|uniref:hypothetical protein n=1 Tax=Faucicola boevrei TaxID=346665 RepID=UPI0003779736|nr:hypothetical protein [Moraxella boevrei]